MIESDVLNVEAGGPFHVIDDAEDLDFFHGDSGHDMLSKDWLHRRVPLHENGATDGCRGRASDLFQPEP
jgi:hypothetical protein